MKKFEYNITELVSPTRKEMDAHLENWGNLSWELVGVVTNGYTGSSFKLFWKREVVKR